MDSDKRRFYFLLYSAEQGVRFCIDPAQWDNADGIGIQTEG